MRLVMTLKVRDEEDVLEANLRYHLAQGIDFFIVTDNGSVDRTPEILSRYQAAGLLHRADGQVREIHVEDSQPDDLGGPQAGERAEQHGRPLVLGKSLLERGHLLSRGHVWSRSPRGR